MPSYRVQVHTDLKPAVSDSQGNVIEKAINRLGYQGVSHVRCGKLITFSLEADNITTAKTLATEIAQRILFNPNLENFHIVKLEEEKL